MRRTRLGVGGDQDEAGDSGVGITLVLAGAARHVEVVMVGEVVPGLR